MVFTSLLREYHVILGSSWTINTTGTVIGFRVTVVLEQRKSDTVTVVCCPTKAVVWGKMWKMSHFDL